MTTHDLAAATDGGCQGAGDEGVQVGSRRLEPAYGVPATPNSPSPAPPLPGECICEPDETTTACKVHFPSYHRPPSVMTRDEYDRIVSAIYDENWRDPGRFPELFAIALAELGTFALAEPGLDGEWVIRESTQAIRRMMRRTIAGETHIETEDHR